MFYYFQEKHKLLEGNIEFKEQKYRCNTVVTKWNFTVGGYFNSLITVKSGNFVTFSAQNIFFTTFCEGTPYLFPCRKFMKKWSGC
jgi:hypothetical protein